MCECALSILILIKNDNVQKRQIEQRKQAQMKKHGV